MLGKRKVPENVGRWPFYLILFFVLLPFGASAQGATEGSGLRQFVLVMLFGLAATVFVRHPKRIRQALDALPVTFVLLLIFTLASVYWSPERFVSFKRVVQVIGVTLMGLALVAGGDGKYRLHRIVSPVLFAGMILAVGVTAAFPDFAFADNGLRAFMATKNNFGQFAAITVLFGVSYLLLERRHYLYFVPLILVGLAGLAASQSMTSILGMVIIVAFLGMLHVLRYGAPVLKVGIYLTAVLLLLVVHAYIVMNGFPSWQGMQDGFYHVTGRDLTFTGRTYLWELMFNEIAKHPWLGTGYGGFWLGMEGASGQVAYLVKWGYPGQAHNGFIDILNEIGIIGFSLLTAFIVQHMINISTMARIDRRYALFHASILVFLLTLNMAEAAVLKTTHFWWIVFMASVIELNWRVKIESPRSNGRFVDMSRSVRPVGARGPVAA